jgi:hypothetical protein
MMPWFYLPFKTGTWGDVEIVTEPNGYAEQRLNGEMIMHNGPQDIGLRGELEFLDDAHGRVLLGGLGFGLLPLLIAMKPNVTEVVVFELYQDVIDSFLAQGYSNPKITIVRGDILTYVDDSEFDCCFFDIYAIQEKDIHAIAQNNKIKDFRWVWWRPYYIKWLAKNKFGIHSLEKFKEFRTMYKFVPDFDEKTLNKYFFLSGPNRQKAEQEMVNGLKQIFDNKNIDRSPI